MMPDWIRWVNWAAAIAIYFAVSEVFRRRRRGIMHDRNALAKRFKTTPDDIVEVNPPAEN